MTRQSLETLGAQVEHMATPQADVKCSPTTCAAKACSSTAMAVLAGTGWSAALACCAGLGKQTQPWTSSPGPSLAVLASRGVWATHNSRTCMDGLVVALMKTAGAAHKSPRNSRLHGLSSRRAQALSITGEAAAYLICNMTEGEPDSVTQPAPPEQAHMPYRQAPQED